MKLNFRHIVFFALLFWAFLSACKKEEKTATPYLNFISYTPLTIPEASGLAVFSSEYYLTVSDSISKVYLMDLEGNIVRSLSFSGKNLEGVTYDPDGPIIYVVEEKNNEVVSLDTSGQEINRFTIPLDNIDPRHGLEGITINPNNGHLYVISEKDPAILFEMDKQGSILSEHELNFAKDYSSVFYELSENVLWILSDDSETLTKTTLDGQPLLTYNTGIKKAEGVIVSTITSRVYLVTDASSFFWVMSF